MENALELLHKRLQNARILLKEGKQESSVEIEAILSEIYKISLKSNEILKANILVPSLLVIEEFIEREKQLLKVLNEQEEKLKSWKYLLWANKIPHENLKDLSYDIDWTVVPKVEPSSRCFSLLNKRFYADNELAVKDANFLSSKKPVRKRVRSGIQSKFNIADVNIE